ncbi:MAG TPA: hypothetical protein VE981_15075 [Planctomycetota bacterium]|nr:hypothetical protein [Planctomycetota bacterium]
MRRLLLVLLGLAGCGPDSDPTALPRVPVAAPRVPIVNRIPPAPLERIAFVREDGIWTVDTQGGDLQRLVPPTLPRAAEPAWASDRRWLAFAAAVDPDANLFPRNLFIVRPDGADLHQVTPMPRAGMSADDGPKGPVRGRAVLVSGEARRPLANLRVTAAGLRKADTTDAEGAFQTFVPVSGGWIRLSGRIDGKPAVAWRFVAGIEGKITDLKDVAVRLAADDLPSSPAWIDQDRQLLYVLRHASVERSAGAPLCTLRRIRLDGSGDESVAAFTSTSILAGPVVRGDMAWIKMSDGLVFRLDLKTKTVTESVPAGLCAPDALAVSPDGGRVATLRMDASGARSLVVLLKNAVEPILEFKAGDPSPRGFDFSPDGTRIVMDLVAPDGKSGLHILAIATKTLTPLLENGTTPTWHGR